MQPMAASLPPDPGDPTAFRDTTTYPHLLSLAHESDLTRVATHLVQTPTDDNGRLAIVKAEVTTSRGVFEGLGDASPESVEPFLVPHLIRVAETRAKARAFRDAVGIGVVSVEEINGSSFPPAVQSPGSGGGNGRFASAPRLQSPSPNPPGNRLPAPIMDTSSMSEGQRRYLFRLMAGRGLKGEAAHEALKEFFQVGNLAQVSKVDATRAIDQFLRDAGQGNGHAVTQH
jgi:hypothetical protein